MSSPQTSPLTLKTLRRMRECMAMGHYDSLETLWCEHFFSGNETPGVLMSEVELTPQQREELMRAWEVRHRIPVIHEPYERLTCTMSNEEYVALLDQVLGEGLSFYL